MHNRLRVKTALQLFGQAVKASQELRDLSGLAHLDIKPDNYVFLNKFQLALIDFGYASAFDEPIGRVTGTDIYLAPEVRTALNRGTAYDPAKVDIFNLGVLLFILVL